MEAPIRRNSSRRLLYIRTEIFISGFLHFGSGGETESKLEFKERSAVGDSNKDSMEGCSKGELWEKVF